MIFQLIRFLLSQTAAVPSHCSFDALVARHLPNLLSATRIHQYTYIDHWQL